MKNRLFVMTGALLTLVACGDDGTMPVDTTDLSTAEIEALFSELGAALSNIDTGIGAGSPSQSGAFAAPIPFSFVVDITVPCDSGDMSFTGSSSGVVDDVTSALDITLDFIWGFNVCVLASPNTETVFTVNSAPAIQYVANITSDPAASTVTVDGTQTGGIRILTSDGRDVTCLFDVTYTASTNTMTGVVSQSVSGTVCGLDVNSIATFTVVTGT